VAAAVAAYGRLDCAHNNAGVEGVVAATADYPEDDWDRVIAVNLTGVWLCLKHEVRQMLAQGAGAIVNTSSLAGLVGGGSGAAYCASKHGVIGLTKRAAREYAGRGIRVNAVCPGLICTPMIERLWADYPDVARQIEPQFLARQLIGRYGTPEEVAEAAVWLCSDAASLITGVALPVDGGWLTG
jgi:NAD(P)-dependent dehydrogenase (short-subunit alcohol dehydrogenase family)